MHDSILEPLTADKSADTAVSTWPRWLWLALVVVAVLWFATLGTRRLLNPDEGRYAEIGREMLVTGDWVTPRLNGIKYFEKPPLQYWMTASAYKVLGENEFAARLWSGLTGFAGIVLAGFAGVRLFGRAAGTMAAAITASCLLYLVIGHINTLDMGLSFFLELTVFSFLLAQRSPTRSAAERNWMLLAWAAAGLAFLSKGLIALVLPSLTLLAYTVVTRELSSWKRLHIVKGLALFLLLILPWLFAAARANPEFLRFFFLHEQFERFLIDSHDRDGPWWYFIPLFALGTLPWTFVALRQFNTAWRLDGQTSGLQVRRFLMLWIVVVIGFFSLSHSKLPPYIVPVIPMFALALSDVFTRLKAQALRTHLLVMGLALGLLGLVIALLPNTIAGAKSVDLVADLRPETAIGLLLASVAMLASNHMSGRKSIELVVIVTGLGVLLGETVLIQGSDALDKTRSGYPLVQPIAAHLDPDTRLYSVGDYDQTLPFYLKRRLTLVNYRGELDFGLSQEPELAIDTVEEFVRIWRNETNAVAVMPPALYAELLQQGLPMQFITQQRKLVAVNKP
jgi:4-amino-4-deoxy-L-arabinose transferase-like glycosyltransferase